MVPTSVARLRMAVLVLAVALPATALAQARQQGSAEASRAALNASRAALDKYKDPIVAVHDGYLSTLGCMAYPKGGGAGQMAYKPGAMGVHFLNANLIGPKLDSTKPQVLIYEPVGDRLRLVAAEWFMPVAVSKTPPTIFGHQLEGPMEGHAPIMPPELRHWDLHVWLWKDNPAGTFHPTNAAVNCPQNGYSFSEDAPHVMKP